MSYIEKHLIPGETLQYQTQLHWIVMLGHACLGAFFEAAGIALLVFSWNAKKSGEIHSNSLIWLGIAAFVAGSIIFAVGLLKRNATVMALTNKRVIVKTGLASRRTIEILLSRIESVVLEEPAMGRMLGYGTVIIRGTGGTPETFDNIAHPLEFRAQVQGQIAEDQKQV
ncbi:MAG: PH domain-containing protein [Chthoniobacterales bacterium]